MYHPDNKYMDELGTVAYAVNYEMRDRDTKRVVYRNPETKKFPGFNQHRLKMHEYCIQRGPHCPYYLVCVFTYGKSLAIVTHYDPCFMYGAKQHISNDCEQEYHKKCVSYMSLLREECTFTKFRHGDRVEAMADHILEMFKLNGEFTNK